MVKFIHQQLPFCIGVAGYPEGHPECSDLSQDIEHLKNKITSGASFIVTQLIFDYKFYFDFVKNLRVIGVEVPVFPGIMPILNLNQINRFTNMCCATVPAELLTRLESVQDNPESVR